MSISFRVIPAHGLVYIRYWDKMMIDEARQAFAEYVIHPDYRAGQKQLIDLRDVTDWERDFPQLLALQARKAEAFYDPMNPTLVATLATTRTAQDVADVIHRSWDHVDGVIYRVATSEEQVLSFLGLSFNSVAELATVK